MNGFRENNFVELTGKIASDFIFSHECKGEKFYKVILEIPRQSDNVDTIPVIVSDRLIDIKSLYDFVWRLVKVAGQIRTRNKYINGKNKLEIFVFATDFFLKADKPGINTIRLDGFFCKPPIYRKTPSGREITDILIVANRQRRKSDYIPCICWGRNARYVSDFAVGARVQLEGRIQSREYIKKLDDGTQETRTAYEVSVSRIDVVESEENKDESRSEAIL